MKPTQARVLLTGATGGIGRAMAMSLRRAGAAVLLVSRSPARLAALGRELSALVPGPAGDPTHPAADGSPLSMLDWHAADLDDPAAIGPLRELAERWRVNVLVNNAGVASFGRFESLEPDHLEQVLRTNLLAPMRLTQALLPHLQRLPQAHVVQVGSALGRLGLPGFGAYSASKFGLLGFSEALRRELAGGPVKVQYLAPRSTRTGFNDARVERYNSATGTHVDPPEVVAQALLALLDSGAAERFIGFPERLVVRLNALIPARLDGLFRKHRQLLPPAGASTPRDGSAPDLPLEEQHT